MNDKRYKEIVSTVAAKYKGAANVSAKDVQSFVSGMTSEWKKMQTMAKKQSAPVKKEVAKSVKAAKKAVKKAVKKSSK
jgi:hypothetical protein